MLRWKRHITKIDKDRHICYTEQKIGEDVMYKIVICDDDKNFISYMKEMLLRCGLSERQVTFYEVIKGSQMRLSFIISEKMKIVYN